MNNTTNPITHEEIGSYGKKWLAFMEENHPRLVKIMRWERRLYDVARSVDESAWEYRELLDNQYMQAHPRPKGFENIVAWERTRDFYTHGAVMREKVLIPISQA